MSNEIVKTGGALAIRPDQTTWTPEQAAVLRQSGIGETVTRAELDGFLHLCQRTGLDPFSRQIYLIGRYDKRAGREVYTPQTGIDGYRVVARRATAKSGGSYGYEDTLWCDESGRWRDVWLTDKPPAAAKVIVIRDGQRFSAVARYSEYVQTNRDGRPIGLWAKMPAGQLAKCTEALALRKAFPHDLAGVYTAEEMAQADNADNPPPAPERHLRRVQPNEPDPWATPNDSEQQPAASKGDYVARARAAATADEVREIYREAGADGFGPNTATMTEIAAIGREKAATEQAPTATSEQEPLDVETVADSEGEHAQAVAELRAAAAAAQVPDVDAEFQASYGLPIDQAATASVREMTALLRRSAA